MTMSKTQWDEFRFILFYLLCGVIAALAQTAINPSSSIPMVGASGGIAGVLGAYLMLHPKAAVRCLMVIIVFFRFINLPAWLVLGGWIGLQFAAAPQAFQGTGGGVAYMAHIGGFMAGVALIPFFKKTHISLFDRGQPPKTWSGQPIKFFRGKAGGTQTFPTFSTANGAQFFSPFKSEDHQKDLGDDIKQRALYLT